MGGMIIRGRVSGSLAVTRALGDLDLKTEVITYSYSLAALKSENSSMRNST